MKKALGGDANRVFNGSKAELKNLPRRRPPSRGARDGQNLISRNHLETQFGEDRCTQFRVIVVTDPQANKHSHIPTNRQDRLQYTAPLSLARSIIFLQTDRQTDRHTRAKT